MKYAEQKFDSNSNRKKNKVKAIFNIEGNEEEIYTSLLSIFYEMIL